MKTARLSALADSSHLWALQRARAAIHAALSGHDRLLPELAGDRGRLRPVAPQQRGRDRVVVPDLDRRERAERVDGALRLFANVQKKRLKLAVGFQIVAAGNLEVGLHFESHTTERTRETADVQGGSQRRERSPILTGYGTYDALWKR